MPIGTFFIAPSDYRSCKTHGISIWKPISQCTVLPGGRNSFRASRPRGRALRSRHALCISASGALKEGELVSSEDDFLRKVSQHQGPIIVDWMAKWCRKCIYLKPKLEKLVEEEFPGLELVFIDVNAVPSSLVYGHGIKKMPTITIHKDGTKVREHIAAEAGLKAITNIRIMINDYMDLHPEERKQVLKKFGGGSVRSLRDAIKHR